MKSNNSVYDYIIIGQGLAGTVLVHLLQKRTSNYLVIDGEKHTTSFAAAGIINPITGRNFIKSWMIDELLPIAIETYTDLEKQLEIKILNKLGIIRTIDSVREENDWQVRTLDSQYEMYLDKLIESKELNQKFNDNCKYSVTKSCYQVNIKDLILAYREKLKSEGKYLSLYVDVKKIEINNDIIVINNLKCKNIIFCQGFKAIENPLFKNIAFKFSKGHSIIFKCDLDIDFNYKDQFYITPIGDKLYWTGYGNEWNTLDENIDEVKITEIKNLIEKKIKQSIEIISTHAGIRPTMVRRKPIVSAHLLHKNVFIFNGLGTKGTSLAPFFAKALIEEIFDDKVISSEYKVSFKDASI